uniref:Uncharacterized protein n=1 Tax=Cannabis sativa TaxID=3483 RepID=A0A803RBX3_CANSA
MKNSKMFWGILKKTLKMECALQKIWGQNMVGTVLFYQCISDLLLYLTELHQKFIAIALQDLQTISMWRVGIATL